MLKPRILVVAAILTACGSDSDAASTPTFDPLVGGDLSLLQEEGVLRAELPSPGCEQAVPMIQFQCARAPGCHGGTETLPNSFQPTFTGDFRAGLIDRSGVFCNSLPFINSQDPLQSSILEAVRDYPDTRECGGASQMPPDFGFGSLFEPLPQAELTDAQVACLTDWVTALAAEARAGLLDLPE